MKIGVIGTGYVGLVTGVGFAECGHEVTCVDIDAARIAQLRAGRVPIYEPGLDEVLRRNHLAGRITFTTNVGDAAANAQVVFIAVGTPSRPDGAADLGFVLAAASDIGKAITRFTVIVTKSTVPVGTAYKVHAAVAEHARCTFAVASNPEFLKEGDALADFMKPARVVVGADDPKAIELMRELYRPLLRTNDRMMVMDACSAELTKYAANAMLSTRISFMNELARLAECVGADIDAIRNAVGADPRIGSKFLFAGCGFGGSCFPKDLRALIHTGREHDVQLSIVQAAEAANERQKRVLGQRILSHYAGALAGRRIAVWGLAFKPETDDIRESPALELIETLRVHGVHAVAYDPAAMRNVRAIYEDVIELAPDSYAAAIAADALVLVTEWRELRHPDLDRLKRLMRDRPVLFDGRNVWSPHAARAAGFTYYGIGRGTM